jgi:hypothetical protein
MTNNDFCLKTTDGSTWQYNAEMQTWYLLGNISGHKVIRGPAGEVYR